MTIALGVLGAATGVATETVTHFIGKKIGQKALASYFRPQNIQYANELGQLLGPTLLGSVVITALNNNPFTIGMKVGMVATAGFFRATDASQITRQELFDDPVTITNLNNCVPHVESNVRREALSKFRLGFASSVAVGTPAEAASIFFNLSFPN